MKKKDETTIKVKRYKNRLKSADKSPYLMRAVPNGVASLDDILQAVAKNTSWTLPTVRLCYNALHEALTEELKKGNKVKTPLGTFETAISGSFPYANSPFGPKNKVYIKITPADELRKSLAKVTPDIVGDSESELMVANVFTGVLGAKGYNVVVPGQPFVVTGDGFQEDGILSVALKDAKGVSHAVTVETRKMSALVCTLPGVAAKGKATLEVVLSGEELDPYRFTASRKVTVR